MNWCTDPYCADASDHDVQRSCLMLPWQTGRSKKVSGVDVPPPDPDEALSTPCSDPPDIALACRCQ